MKNFMFAFIAVAGLVLVNSTTVEAGHGYRGNHYGNHYGGGYGVGYGCYNTYRPVVHSTWHDTSHYDWHPGRVTRHNNHLHYTPGHYHYHRTGHYDNYVHH